MLILLPVTSRILSSRGWMRALSFIMRRERAQFRWNNSATIKPHAARWWFLRYLLLNQGKKTLKNQSSRFSSVSAVFKIRKTSYKQTPVETNSSSSLANVSFCCCSSNYFGSHYTYGACNPRPTMASGQATKRLSCLSSWKAQEWSAAACICMAGVWPEQGEATAHRQNKSLLSIQTWNF